MKLLQQIIREKLGGQPQKRLSQLEKEYYATQTNKSVKLSYDELLKSWLRKLIVDNAGTPNSLYIADLALQAAAAKAGRVGKTLHENLLIIYLTL